MKLKFLSYLFIIFILGCSTSETYDLLIKNGRIIDGSGEIAFEGDIGINADTIAVIGILDGAKGKKIIDATGMVVTPGFINMLSWATESLIEDGRSLSDIKQGVTLEVFGEGRTMGPLSASMKKEALNAQGDVKYDISWNTLGEYLENLEKNGVATNVASFVGAAAVRIHTMGYANRKPTSTELDSMKGLVRQAMMEGALGVSSALIYAPGAYAGTEELIELCKVASEFDGMYTSHLRSESTKLLESLDELIEIADAAEIRAEVYHLKQAGKANWDKLERVINKIDSSRTAGLSITANMYTYTAASTGLTSSIPSWIMSGGYSKMANRIGNQDTLKQVLDEMTHPSNTWESLMQAAGTSDNIKLIGFKTDSLKYLTGKTLTEVAKMRKKSPEETALELVVQDNSRVESVYPQQFSKGMVHVFVNGTQVIDNGKHTNLFPGRVVHGPGWKE